MSERCSAEDFGPIHFTAIEDFEGGPTEWNALNAEEKKLKKTGYERVKEKVKTVRQSYRKAVTEGRRSGSGKLVCDNWDFLKIIWAGSPAVTSITNSISSTSFDDKNQSSDEDESDEENSAAESNDEEDLSVKNKKKKTDSNSEQKEASDLEQSASSKITAKFVDDKRKQLQKNLSANQRDQQYLGVAMKDLQMKETLVKTLKESNSETNKMMEKISESISSVGKSIGDGMALLAQALAPPQLPSERGFNHYMATGYQTNESFYDENNNGANQPIYKNL